MSEGGGGGPSSFGCFRSGVGSKAGGFIAKKFFHPSSIRNQEKVWKNQEKAKELEAAELERQKRRDEERQVDELRKQMHARGQTKREDDLLKRTVQTKVATGEEAVLQAEHKKRLMALRKLDEQEAVVVASTSHKSAVSSKYTEGVTQDGHSEVWGSLYDPTTKKWGYKCCATFDQHVACPNAGDKNHSTNRSLPSDQSQCNQSSSPRASSPANKSHFNGADRKKRDINQSSQGESPSARKKRHVGTGSTDLPQPSDTTEERTKQKETTVGDGSAARQQNPGRRGAPKSTDDAQSRAQYMDALFQDPCA